METVNIMTRIAYQSEIDGLRALAVLSVLFYHIGFKQVSGGFVGVDVFFVISGYLITRLIVTEIQESASFRFGRFYIRRIRRLFPALICTILLSWLGAFLLFSPEQMINFGASAGTAVLSMSNFYFWSQAGYFDTLSITKPLLHTWSLCVEEQFYIIWPAAIVLIYTQFGQRKLIFFLVAACLGSFFFTQYLIFVDTSAAFYLLPSRVMELGIGALLVWVRPPKTGWRLDALALLGIGLILFATISFDINTPFPGAYALVPCAGTTSVIIAVKSRYVAGVLRLKPIVWIGRISYSLYLVHWPIIVFYFAYNYQEPGLWSQLGIITLSIFMAWLQYNFIEERFRYIQKHSWSSRGVAFTAIFCALFISTLSFAAFSQDGWTWRLDSKRQTLTSKEWYQIEKRRYCENDSPGKDPHLFTCQNYRHMKKNIFLWGDSHALHLVAGFSEAYPDHNVFVAYSNGCVPQSGFNGYIRNFKTEEEIQKCTQHNSRVLEYFLQSEPTNIVITNAKRSIPKVIGEATISIEKKLRQVGHKVIILGDFIRPGVPLNDCVAVPSILISDERLKERCTGRIESQERELKYNIELAEIVSNIILPNRVQCPNEQCKYVVNGQLLYRDHHHLNIVGSVHFLNKLKSQIPL